MSISRASIAREALRYGLVTVVAGAFALALLELAAWRPFGPASTPPSAAGEAADTGAGEAPVPVPPYTRLAFSSRTAGGAQYHLESGLSIDGLRIFYGREMPRAGWERDDSYDVAAGRAGALQPSLSFSRPGRRCIIGMAESGPFTVDVTIVLVRRGPGRRS